MKFSITNLKSFVKFQKDSAAFLLNPDKDGNVFVETIRGAKYNDRPFTLQYIGLLSGTRIDEDLPVRFSAEVLRPLLETWPEQGLITIEPEGITKDPATGKGQVILTCKATGDVKTASLECLSSPDEQGQYRMAALQPTDVPNLSGAWFSDEGYIFQLKTLTGYHIRITKKDMTPADVVAFLQDHVKVADPKITLEVIDGFIKALDQTKTAETIPASRATGRRRSRTITPEPTKPEGTGLDVIADAIAPEIAPEPNTPADDSGRAQESVPVPTPQPSPETSKTTESSTPATVPPADIPAPVPEPVTKPAKATPPEVPPPNKPVAVPPAVSEPQNQNLSTITAARLVEMLIECQRTQLTILNELNNRMISLKALKEQVFGK